jgi:uncharacterized membrane protein
VRVNRWTLLFSRYWIRPILVVLGLYAFLPIAAPVMMHLGLTGPAKTIYTLYSPVCHQFSFRSWFLFGEQSAYPRESANIAGLTPYEAYLPEVDAQTVPPPNTPANLKLELTSKSFIGDEKMGYKVAICQRDIAIYTALFLGGLIYMLPVVRKYLRPVPWWLYVLLGLLPIGIDGFSQLLSNPLPPLWTTGLWPVRETHPFFRTITGALFGLMNAWLAFPYLEQSARDVVKEIESKFERRQQREIATDKT